MEKISYEEFSHKMREFNRMHSNGEDNCTLTGVIVYKQENWEKEYTLEERSYEVTNHNRAFQEGKIANSISGTSLDGSDVGVRLDWYKWKVEYCYIEGEYIGKERIK